MYEVKLESYTPKTDKRNIESFRKEKGFVAEFALIDIDKGESVILSRIYRTPSTSYCITWINGSVTRSAARGYGKASGYGYHRDSAAMCESLTQCGVKLVEPIGGRGEGAMKDALKSLAVELGVARAMIHYSHA